MNKQIVTYADKKEAVKAFISDLVKETGHVYGLIKDSQSIRTMALLAFANLEVYSCYWALYNGDSERKNKDKIISWLNEYFYSKNKYLTDFPHYKKISAEDLYNLRCNTVHFFSSTYKGLSISNGDERTLEKCFFEDGRITISAMSLNLFIWEGAIMMLKILLDERNTTKEHQAGIERIFEKIQNEGAIMINLER